MARYLACTVLLSLTVLSLSFTHSRAQTPQGDVVNVNTLTTVGVLNGGPRVLSNADEGFKVVWNGRDNTSQTGIFLREFDGAASPLGAETRISAVDRAVLDASIDPAGSFTVVWVDDDGSELGIFAEVFDAAGASVTGPFEVNTTTANRQYRPAVAKDAAGNFIVTWGSFGGDGSERGVLARRYDASGSPLTGEFLVNTYTTSAQTDPDVEFATNGEFLIVWHGFQTGNNAPTIYGQRYTNDATKIGGEMQISEGTSSRDVNPSIGFRPSGDFVVSWERGFYGVAMRRFNANSDGVGEQTVHVQADFEPSDPRVAVDRQGNFVVAWHDFDYYYGTSFNSRLRAFDARGQGESVLTRFASSNRSAQTDATYLETGEFFSVWVQAGGIKGQLYTQGESFDDGFESGDASAWSVIEGGP